MANNPKHMDNLEKWPKGTSGNPKGRPKKLWSTLNKELGEKGYSTITRSEFYGVIGKLMQLTTEELKEYQSQSDIPAWIKWTIGSWSEKKNREKTLSDYRDWMFGRSKLQVDIPDDTKEVIYSISGFGRKKDKI